MKKRGMESHKTYRKRNKVAKVSPFLSAITLNEMNYTLQPKVIE